MTQRLESSKLSANNAGIEGKKEFGRAVAGAPGTLVLSTMNSFGLVRLEHANPAVSITYVCCHSSGLETENLNLPSARLLSIAQIDELGSGPPFICVAAGRELGGD